jgi:wyosine [tRNA(Phe)-imidazoG37] synthetase (radical SAM superfamily)
MKSDLPTPEPDSPGNPPFDAHSRSFAENLYVYPVLSRRAGGISIGVNLNLDRICNFHCVYCQVEHKAGEGNKGDSPIFTGVKIGTVPLVDLARLTQELDRVVELVASGRIFEGPRFQNTPPQLRRLNDIALSGDGEPTSFANFAAVVEVCAKVRRRHKLDAMKIVLITNGSLLDRPRVKEALAVLDANNGEIWAKLDAGTEDFYKLVARSAVPFRRILDNLRETAILRPIVIQSLFMRLHDQLPTAEELDAYCDRLNEIVAAGGRIKLVQVHTIARKPAEPYVAALSNAEVDAIAEQVRRRTGLPVAAFYGGATGG